MTAMAALTQKLQLPTKSADGTKNACIRKHEPMKKVFFRVSRGPAGYLLTEQAGNSGAFFGIHSSGDVPGNAVPDALAGDACRCSQLLFVLFETFRKILRLLGQKRGTEIFNV